MSGYPGHGYGPGGYYRQDPPPPPPFEPRPQGYGNGGGGGGGYQYYPPQQQAYAPAPPPQYQPPLQHPPHHQSQYVYPLSYDDYDAQPAAPMPPTGQAQQFGQGAPPGYTFQYSACTGRRRALLIGINYIGQANALHGCINDVRNVSRFLTQYHGYRSEDMVLLTDDQTEPVRRPTRDNILRAMRWLVDGARPNDALFLHYSGHGGQTRDLDGDEDDGYDEVIYPVDFCATSHIVDDEIHAMVVRPLPAGVRLTAIFDSCHSGSVMDLPYVYSTRGVLKEPNLAKEAGQGLLQAALAYGRGDLSAVANSIFVLAKSAVQGGGSPSAREKTIATKTSPADVVLWSGSKDDQTSADATISAQATGAMSWAFITALSRNPHQSYVQLLNSIRDVLATRYTQKPQLSCSHPLDTNLLFVM